MEKARLTERQAIVFKRALEGKHKTTIMLNWLRNNTDLDTRALLMEHFNTDLLGQCLYDPRGYEVIGEDQAVVVTEKIRKDLRENFEPVTGVHAEWNEGYQSGIKDTLQALGIIVNGINDKEGRR